jgi:hypothetical protein
MRTIEQKIYKFNELSKDIQQKVIDKWYESEDYPFLSEDLKESLKGMDNNCWENVELNYSLSCSQGDGLNFKADFNFELFLNKVYNKKLKTSIKKELLELVYKIYSKGNTGLYAYASPNDIEFEYNSIDSNENPSKLENTFETEILPEIQSYYMSVCKEIEKEGYGILEYRMSIDEFAEHSEVNEYEYFADGKLL